MILPPATLGVLGGGQLGRYFVLAAQQMGYKTCVLDPDPLSPAGAVANEHIIAQYHDQAALQKMASLCAAITTEFENVPADTLQFLARSVPVKPDARCVSQCQNRSKEKSFLTEQGFPCAPYADIATAADIQNAAAQLFPGILKTATQGYDGKGQVTVHSREDAVEKLATFNGAICVLEQKLALEAELSVVVARNTLGDTQFFSAIQNVHYRGILDYSISPAMDIAEPLLQQAQTMAKSLIEKLNYIGTMAVEFFVVNGALLINEIAPRPHNSGHYTLDACFASQFEQQVRALCNLPLADNHFHSAAVMVNILGDLWFTNNAAEAQEPAWQLLLAIPNLHLHLYGKHEAKRGRKMGHFTVLRKTPEEAFSAAMLARAAMGIRHD